MLSDNHYHQLLHVHSQSRCVIKGSSYHALSKALHHSTAPKRTTVLSARQCCSRAGVGVRGRERWKRPDPQRERGITSTVEDGAPAVALCASARCTSDTMRCDGDVPAQCVARDERTGKIEGAEVLSMVMVSTWRRRRRAVQRGQEVCVSVRV